MVWARFEVDVAKETRGSTAVENKLKKLETNVQKDDAFAAKRRF